LPRRRAGDVSDASRLVFDQWCFLSTDKYWIGKRVEIVTQVTSGGFSIKPTHDCQTIALTSAMPARSSARLSLKGIRNRSRKNNGMTASP
jgi:hypothetical protein